ncbi:MAG TPA: cytochrome C oxidase Cbb3, partial [Aeromonadales bacterium]|nr:cytochrome C oxidase Cbb3 [Aeromonadales bacterium]
FFFSPDYREVIGAARPLDSGRKGKIKNGQVIQLDVRRKIADLDLPGMPHLGSGIVFNYKGHQVLATPSLREAEVDVIDMSNWKTIKKIKTNGPGFFMRSHENTPYAWSDVFFGPHKDEVHIIDKRTLKIIKTLKPEPGKTAAHIEFTRDGRYALLSIMEMDGAIIVYDAKTFKEVKRLPMKRPVGKYNVYNKTHLSLGTSH